MAPIKCVGCFKLLRDKVDLGDKPLIVYRCGFLPYACALRGLLHPTPAMVGSVSRCPEQLDQRCVIEGCPNHDLQSYGKDKIVHICKAHDWVWGKWLAEHPDRRAHLRPKGRMSTTAWVEVFREFLEDMRK